MNEESRRLGLGNVQPFFIGVFDAVAALGSRSATMLAFGGLLAFVLFTYWVHSVAPGWITALVALIPIVAAYWFLVGVAGQYKYFFADPNRKPNWWNPCDWIALYRNGHMAWWSGKHYDRYVDREVRFLRHAVSIDEERKKFPRVGWGRPEDVTWNQERGNVDWIKQVWFSGNHSDVGGSYSEEESRLSDVALRWMVEELKAAVPEIKVRGELLVTSPDPLGLQHDQRQALLDRQPAFLSKLTRGKLTWARRIRDIHVEAKLHQSVLDRFQAAAVPQMGDMKPYRPDGLRSHVQVKHYYQ